MTERPEEPDVPDPALRDAAGLVRGLPAGTPPASIADQVVAQVPPLAVRRRRILLLTLGAALLGAIVWVAMFHAVVSEAEGLSAP